MKTEYAWKVVRVIGDSFFSSAWTLPHVEYKVGKVTRPPRIHRYFRNYPFLFVFKTRAKARRYINNTFTFVDRRQEGQQFKIFKCEVTNLTDKLTDLESRHFYDAMFVDSVKLIA